MPIGEKSQIYLAVRKPTACALFLICLNTTGCIRNQFRTYQLPPLCSAGTSPVSYKPGWMRKSRTAPAGRNPGPQRHLPARGSHGGRTDRGHTNPRGSEPSHLVYNNSQIAEGRLKRQLNQHFGTVTRHLI